MILRDQYSGTFPIEAAARWPLRSRWVLLIALAGIAVFAVLAGFGEFRAVGRHLATFPLQHLLLALGLALLNYLLRFLRWLYYLRLLGLRATIQQSGLIFTAGLAMTLTPGHAGELGKAFLLRQMAGAPVARSTPAILMERLTDLIAVSLISLTAISPFSSRLLVVAAVGSMLVLALAVVASRGGALPLRLARLRRWRTIIDESQSSFRTLTRPVALAVATSLALAAWSAEGVALWVVLRGLEAEVALSTAVLLYAVSTLIGALLLIPGGLVGTEASMVGLLWQIGVGSPAAPAATILVRLCTLWFAVALGLAAVLALQFHGGSTPPGGGDPEPPAAEVNKEGA
jgi:uncharacterized membrane protein YbhN (UPF0104 family)